MIRWKTVREDRTSCYSPLGYARKYLVGKTVKAKKGTLGLMCFETHTDAAIFAFVHNLKVIKVRTKSRGKRPKHIAPGGFTLRYKANFDAFYRAPRRSMELRHPPSGTICYQSVEVLT
uniref:Uncharacterized protein n=1 Tax=viral metagenome TaxID=1070528 RepID=A0A6M3JRX3_9ZZZZ